MGGLLDELLTAEEAWAQHEQEEPISCGRDNLESERAKLRRQFHVHAALDASDAHPRRGQQPVVRAQVEYGAINHLLRQLELIAQAHSPNWPVRRSNPGACGAGAADAL